MKLTTFFEKYDQIAGAPDAVTKIRELVLDLAMPGLHGRELLGPHLHDESLGEHRARTRPNTATRVTANLHTRTVQNGRALPQGRGESCGNSWPRLSALGRHRVGTMVVNNRDTGWLVLTR